VPSRLAQLRSSVVKNAERALISGVADDDEKAFNMLMMRRRAPVLAETWR